MEFKNFENKLIVEKITNYCIENNISTQKINALTAKIKFGKLNEADSWTDWAGEKIGTGAGRYRKSIRVVQDNLQKAMDYLKAVNADLGPGADNIFTKNKVSLDDAKKNALQNAVSQLNGAIAQYSPVVANSLKQIGGQITGASNYGDEQSFDFDAMFPELKTNGTLAQAFKTAYTTAGAPFPSDKQADLSRILLTSRQNILKTFKVLDASKHGEFIQKIKDTVAKVITKFGAPTTVADGYALLNTIVGGTHTPTSNPTKLPLVERTVKAILANPKLNQVYYNDLITTHLAEIAKLFEPVYDGNSLNVPKMRTLFEKAFLNVPESLANPPAPAVAATAADPKVSDKIIDQIQAFFIS
jgi:hypothetical protein